MRRGTAARAGWTAGRSATGRAAEPLATTRWPGKRARAVAAAASALALTGALVGAVPQAAAGPPAAPAGEGPSSGPVSPNPYLALLPEPATKEETLAWRGRLARQGDARAAAGVAQRAAQRALAALPAPVVPPIVIDEFEPAGARGYNDTPQSAQLLRGFGTGARENPRARVLGRLSVAPLPTPTTIAAAAEDDGSIPLAGPTGIGPTRAAATWSAAIGDGPHGSTGTRTGDFDVRQVQATAGQELTVATGGPLDSVVALYAADGTRVAYDDDSGPGLSSLLTYTVPTTGAYYAFVGGYRTFGGAPPNLPRDPFDSASGQGVGSQNTYTGTISVTAPRFDRDWYSAELVPGDVIGTTSKGAALAMSILDPQLIERITSDQDFSGIYPADSPLPGGGVFTNAYVAKEAGLHYFGLPSGDGAYDTTFEVYRAGTPAGARVTQTLFLDFDGARVNTAIFGGPGVRELSPLEAFLGRWGLGSQDLRALQDAIVAEVRENVRDDLVASGINRRLSVRVVGSHRQPDTFGEPGVTRLVVGGSIAESGISTIGIAQSIDPGNFGRDETALVLLDVLSNPAGPASSLNTYLTPATTDRLGFVAQAVGNVTAHEAGHVIGSFHTENANTLANLMDQGGQNFQLLFGVGPDGVGGTADDPDVDFVTDALDVDEGLSGLEDTAAITAFGLTR